MRWENEGTGLSWEEWNGGRLLVKQWEEDTQMGWKEDQKCREEESECNVQDGKENGESTPKGYRRLLQLVNKEEGPGLY